MRDRTSRMTMSVASFEEAARAATSAFSIESLTGSASPSLPSISGHALLMSHRFLSGALRGASGASLSDEVGSEYHGQVNHAGLRGLRPILPRHRDGPRTQGFRRVPPDPLPGLRARVNDDPGRVDGTGAGGALPCGDEAARSQEER